MGNQFAGGSVKANGGWERSLSETVRKFEACWRANRKPRGEPGFGPRRPISRVLWPLSRFTVKAFIPC